MRLRGRHAEGDAKMETQASPARGRERVGAAALGSADEVVIGESSSSGRRGWQL